MEWDPKEIEYERRCSALLTCKTEEEAEKVRKRIREFERENRELVEKLQRKRWTAYGPEE
ncbi:MAG: hypothetical protein LBR24_03940 [Methanobrevibacter sp.]|jgi:hypothetical protein|nr:hypothetical protein [Methanobrevibacter sp.]